MKMRPVIFSGEMVRALLDGRKTQTRRLASSPLRLVEPGDGLWVREAFKPVHSADPSRGAHYRADSARDDTVWRPSIHMPRWASRLTLKVTSVRTEPLQAISYEDVLAEGCPVDPNYHDTTQDGSSPHMVNFGIAQWRSPRAWYHQLWDGLHPKEPWHDNPEVVVLSFAVELAQ